MEKCCTVVYMFKNITWTKTTGTICMVPFVLLMLIAIILLLISVDKPGAVVSNSRICAKVGTRILSAKGSVVDAAIATMLCEGIALPNSAGIGGGFTAILRVEGQLDSLIAMPTFPQESENITQFDSSFASGAKSAGIPGELKGYWEMHQKYGLLSWREIIEPSIKLCQEGIPITEWFAGVLRHNSQKLASSPSMSKIFPPWQRNLYQQDFKIRFPALAKTLQMIADQGVEPFYGGEVGKAFVKDIREAGGIISLEDLKNYKVLWNKKVPCARLRRRYKVVTTPLPSAGAVIVFILNVIKGVRYDYDFQSFWHYFVEAVKFGFAMSRNLGDAENDPEFANIIHETYKKMTDPDFAREIRGRINEYVTFNTSQSYWGNDKIFGKGSVNICILAPNGDVVAATSSLLHQFGAFFCSTETGIIVNNLILKYLTTKNEIPVSSQPNRPKPRKQMLSPHTPSVVFDELERPYFIVGASGGSKSITLVVNAIIKYVIFTQTAAESIDAKQLHHQLFPNWVQYEEDFDSRILDYLKKVGHKVVYRPSSYNNISASTCIGYRNGKPDPQFNIRMGGSKSVVKSKHELDFILVAIMVTLCISVFGIMLYEVLHPRKLK